ncbi:MAG: hypothetical protein ACRCYU_01980 [Nocardioides sp.]
MAVESTRGDAYLSWEPKRWRHRLPEDYLASLVAALDSVFFAASFERGPAYRLTVADESAKQRLDGVASWSRFRSADPDDPWESGACYGNGLLIIGTARGHVELMANPRTPPEAVAELVKTWLDNTW